MLVFHFGMMRPAAKTEMASLKNKQRGSVGDFALHIQCQWHIEMSDSILVDGNMQDQLIDQFVSDNEDRTIESVSVQSQGSFTLVFDCSAELVVFPSGSVGEDWRLFRPNSDQPHLVISGGTVEQQDS